MGSEMCIRDRVFQYAHRGPADAPGHDGIAVTGLQQGRFIVFVDLALSACQQTGTDLHTSRPQCQRCSQPAPIGDAARSNDRHMDGIDDLRDKCHRRGLANMAA